MKYRLIDNKKKLSKITDYNDIYPIKKDGIIVKVCKSIENKIKKLTRDHRPFIKDDSIDFFQIIIKVFICINTYMKVFISDSDI